MSEYFLKVPLIVDTCVEYPSVTRGRTFFDTYRNSRGVEIWAGALHVSIDPEPWPRLLAAAAIVLSTGILLGRTWG
jgi:hypothetical protein